MKVFLSCGKTYTTQQEEFVAALESFLRRNDCEPLTVGRTVGAPKQPVLHARSAMQECDGAVVVAFSRYKVSREIEFPETDKSRERRNLRYPTVWNQLEAAMAYGLNLPLLILVERGLKRQGMLSDRTEWFPREIDLDPALFETKDFRLTFEGWKKLVELRKAHPTRDLATEALTVGQLLLTLTPGQLWKVLGALATLLAAVAAAGYWLGQTLVGSP